MFSKKLNMFHGKIYKKNEIIRKIELIRPEYINLEMIINKYNIGIGKRQLNIKNKNVIDPANTVYNCKNLRSLIFSYFGKNHYGDLRYILNLDRSKDFKIILNEDKNIVFDNDINSIYIGFFKHIYDEYNINKLPLYNILNILNIDQECLYMKIIYKLTRAPLFTIPILKRFLNKYNIYCKSNSRKYYYVRALLNILINNYSRNFKDNKLNLKMVINTYENNSNIYLNFDYIIDYKISFG